MTVFFSSKFMESNWKWAVDCTTGKCVPLHWPINAGARFSDYISHSNVWLLFIWIYLRLDIWNILSDTFAHFHSKYSSYPSANTHMFLCPVENASFEWTYEPFMQFSNWQFVILLIGWTLKFLKAMSNPSMFGNHTQPGHEVICSEVFIFGGFVQIFSISRCEFLVLCLIKMKLNSLKLNYRWN